MEQNGLKGVQHGLWAIAASLLILTLSLMLTKKPRYLPNAGLILDTYTGQQFRLNNTNAPVKAPTIRFDKFTGKISD